MSGMACNCLELFELQEGAISKVFPYLDNKHWAHAFLGQHRLDANLHLNHHLATFLHVSCFSPAAFTGLYFTQDSSTVILGPAPVVLTIQLAVQVQQSIQFDKVQGKQKGSGVFEAWKVIFLLLSSFLFLPFCFSFLGHHHILMRQATLDGYVQEDRVEDSL